MASKKFKIFAVVSFCTVAACLGLVMFIVRTGSPDPTPAPALNKAAVKFAALALIDDLEVGQDGGNSMFGTMPYPDLMAWTKIDAKTTARQYDIAYDSNEIAADNQYKGKKLLVSGTIDSIEKDVMDAGFLMLRAGNPVGVRAELKSEAMVEAASFARGQKIDLVCTGGGRVAGIANLDDCQPYSDYLRNLDPSIESRIEDFLSGKTTLHTQAARAVVVLYVGGTRLPPGSSCLEGKDNKSCDYDLNATFKDSTQDHALNAAIQETMAGVKVAK
jgi:hypothetical protein